MERKGGRWFSYLRLVQLTQHHHCEREHYHITAQHFPHVKEDGLEADVVEASGGEDDDGDVVFATFPGAQVDQVLLKVETVLIGHLKLKPNSACVHFHSILRNLEFRDFGDRLEIDVDVPHLH